MRLQELLKPGRKKTIAVPMAHPDQIINCVADARRERIADTIKRSLSPIPG